ncbi:MAG: hypothetical protein J2P27_01370 [Actinobacteria bacterium]|nr:hypothetical protein [Actinomycetota bacterium]
MTGESSARMPGIYVHLSYDRPADAVEWLCRVFDLREIRLEHSDAAEPHMLAGPCGGMVMIWGLTEDFKGWMRSRAPRFHEPGERPWPYLSHSVSVHVLNVDEHHKRSQRESAMVLSLPTDQPWGVRSYSALDTEGHQWEFVQMLDAAAAGAVG